MGRLALFLGAGSSKPFGYPLTAEILPLVVERAREHRLFQGPRCDGAVPNVAECENLLESLSKIFPGAFTGVTTASALPQVTDVLSLLDRLVQDGLGLGPNFARADVLECRRLLERAIAEVLDGPSALPLVDAPLKLKRRWARALVERESALDEVTVITTNYDLLLEQAIYECLASGAPLPSLKQLAASVDYGFDWRMPFYGDYEPITHRPPNPRVRLYKLHGSLNWLRCAVCGYIYINPRGAVYHQAYCESPDVHNSCTCGAWPLGSVLVTPSSVRDVRDFNLLSVWNSALEALRTADEWIFVGYSLPGEDVSIRSLLLRAFSGWRASATCAKPRVRVYLFGGGKGEAAVTSPERARYQAMFPGIEVHWGGVLEHIEHLSAG